MLRVAGPVLLTTSLAACGDDPTRAVVLTPDPARYEACPATFPAAPALAPLTSFTLPDGREVVILDVVIARETVVAKYVLKGREAWFRCRQPVTYTTDWIREVTKPER